MRVLADFRVDQDSAEKNKISKLWMNYIAMNSHLAQASGDRDWLVGNHPHLRSPTIGLHGKAGGPAIDRADPNPLQGGHDSPCNFIGVIGRVMEFQVGNRAGRGADVFSVHAADEADER